MKAHWVLEFGGLAQLGVQGIIFHHVESSDSTSFYVQGHKKSRNTSFPLFLSLRRVKSLSVLTSLHFWRWTPLYLWVIAFQRHSHIFSTLHCTKKRHTQKSTISCKSSGVLLFKTCHFKGCCIGFGRAWEPESISDFHNTYTTALTTPFDMVFKQRRVIQRRPVWLYMDFCMLRVSSTKTLLTHQDMDRGHLGASGSSQPGTALAPCAEPCGIRTLINVPHKKYLLSQNMNNHSPDSRFVGGIQQLDKTECNHTHTHGPNFNQKHETPTMHCGTNSLLASSWLKCILR